MTNDVRQALETLTNSGIIARDGTEAEMLQLFRKLPAPIKDRQIARMAGFLEAFEMMRIGCTTKTKSSAVK